MSDPNVDVAPVSKVPEDDGDFDVAQVVEDYMFRFPIDSAVQHLLHRLSDLREATNLAWPAVGKAQIAALDEYKRIIHDAVQLDEQQKNSQVVDKELETRAISAAMKAIVGAERIKRSHASPVLIRSMFIGMFSEFDAFIGNLLRAIYSLKPDLFGSLNRSIDLGDLIRLGSVEAIKLEVLNKEIETIRRGSYVEQFTTFENRFGISLKKFEEWPAFVELSQRRNLYTHNDGLCSEQYIDVCTREGFKFKEKPAFGQSLELDGAYFGNAVRIVTKVAVILAHTLWRKLLPAEIEAADTKLNDVLFDLLLAERWRTASEIGSACLDGPIGQKSSDLARRIRITNTAIALKRAGKLEECKALLNKYDWTASAGDFQLAVKVLTDEYAAASEMMRAIGQRGLLINQYSYHDWPLFIEFRDSQEFQDAYKIVYGSPFLRDLAKKAQADVSKKEIGEIGSVDVRVEIENSAAVAEAAVVVEVVSEIQASEIVSVRDEMQASVIMSVPSETHPLVGSADIPVG